MSIEDYKRRPRAILSADVEGYSRLMGEDEDNTVRTLTAYRRIMSSLIEKHHGRVVDSPGDNILAEFESVRDAVLSAIEIQKKLQIQNSELPENRKMRFRIGINVGDIIQDGDRIYGDGVNVAARIESLADAGGISISRTAYDQVKNKIPIEYVYLGEYEVKNIKDPVRVYKIVLDSNRDKSIQDEKINPSYTVEEKKPSIVVLPFVNMSNDPDQEYFSDGITEEIINALANVGGLKVTSRTSSFFFKRKDVDLRTIGEKLNVNNVIEGSVRKAGNKIRITAQLIKVADDTHLWSETYSREFKDIFKIQEDIANSVAEKLKLSLEAFNQLGGTENINAYDLYLQAKGKRAEAGTSNVKSALNLIDAAISLDPEFALAWSFKSYLHGQLCVFESPDSTIKEADVAIKAAQNAIDLEPKLGDAYINLGHIYLIKSEWIGAEINFRKGLELIDGLLSGDDIYIFVFYSAVGNNKR